MQSLCIDLKAIAIKLQFPLNYNFHQITIVFSRFVVLRIKMKFYLFLCMSLALENCVCARNIELLNTEIIMDSSRNTTMQNIESTPATENTSSTISEPECPEYMLSAPWRPVATTLECYCEFPFLPLPVNNTCFDLFMQAPCEPGKFLVQPSRDNKGKLPSPRCAPNSCLEDGLVPYNGTCYNIIMDTLCEYGHLYFREATSDLQCVYPEVDRSSINVPLRPQCPVGSRKSRNGICRKKL